jgi:hypothetical protein
MDLMEKLGSIGERAEKVGHMLETEEAVKTSLILPFIAALGYDIHNPLEVIPEFTADVGIKKGEKVDYAIMADNQIMFLVECKKLGADLNNYTGQLFRYFTVTDARVAILTDGVIYKFYSDLEDTNKLDPTPFYTLNLCDLRETVIRDLPKITKEHLDPDGLLLMAQDLKYISEVKNILRKEFREPTWLAAALIAQTSFNGKRTRSVLNWFSALTSKAIKRLEDNYIRERLNLNISPMEKVAEDKVFIEEREDSEVDEPEIDTTLEEHEGFHYVKCVASDVIDPTRLFIRDTRSYCGILVDDNNRKPVCRLHFNNLSRKTISFGREAEKFSIDEVIDILKFRDKIIDYLSEYTER